MRNNIPKSVSEAFPLLQGKTFVRQLASPVPLIPDLTFDIFSADSQDFFALVTTDHVDPYDQSRELKSISGQYEFEFTHLMKPFDNEKTIKVLPNDEMDGDFFVVAPYKKYNLYYYVASLKSNLIS